MLPRQVDSAKTTLSKIGYNTAIMDERTLYQAATLHTPDTPLGIAMLVDTTVRHIFLDDKTNPDTCTNLSHLPNFIRRSRCVFLGSKRQGYGDGRPCGLCKANVIRSVRLPMDAPARNPRPPESRLPSPARRPQ